MMKAVIYENPKTGKRIRIKKGINWLVLGFGPLWFLFNGMIIHGLLWLCAALTVGLFTAGIGGLFIWLVASLFANRQRERLLLNKGWQAV